MADKNLTQSFLKDRIHSSLAAFFSVTFFKVSRTTKPRPTCFGCLWFFLSAGSILLNFLNLMAFSTLNVSKNGPLYSLTNLLKMIPNKELLGLHFEISSEILALALPKKQEIPT